MDWIVWPEARRFERGSVWLWSAAMLFYMLNTGQSGESPRCEVTDVAIAALGPLLKAGWHAIPEPAEYECHTAVNGGLLCNVTDAPSKRECVLFGVAKNDEQAEQVWKAIERAYQGLSHERPFRSADFAPPYRPQTAPWCAMITILATPAEALWMAKFACGVAWAWIEHR
ncbi:MAG TPA: hypothetical protein VHY91_02345 [Pirellulales bacterium]|nr:hypothetical protein [Pirellulales bacterium]